MIDEPKDVRLPIMVSRSEAEAIDEFRFQNRISTRAEAIRRLIKLGLAAGNQVDERAGNARKEPSE
jgi:hypothetical protein